MSFQHQLLNVLLRGLVIYAVLGLEFTQAHGQPGSHTTDAASLATTGRQTMTHQCFHTSFLPSLLSLPLPRWLQGDPCVQGFQVKSHCISLVSSFSSFSSSSSSFILLLLNGMRDVTGMPTCHVFHTTHQEVFSLVVCQVSQI